MNPPNKLRTLVQAAKDRLLFKQDLEHIISTPQGKRFFRRFLKDCHVTKPRFTKDPLETQWMEGRRHLATSYLKVLSTPDPEQDLIEQMEQEGPEYDK